MNEHIQMIKELIQRLEGGEHGHIINCHIHAVMGHPDTHMPLDYTRSVDAALTLVPKGWAWFVERIEGFTGGDARVWIPSKRTQGLPSETFNVRETASPAIALCIVSFQAMIALVEHEERKRIDDKFYPRLFPGLFNR